MNTRNALVILLLSSITLVLFSCSKEETPDSTPKIETPSPKPTDSTTTNPVIANNTMIVDGDTINLQTVTGTILTIGQSRYSVQGSSVDFTKILAVNLLGTTAPENNSTFPIDGTINDGSAQVLLTLDGAIYVGITGSVKCTLVNNKVRVSFNNATFRLITDQSITKTASGMMTVN
ncbi:MAG: hypothetical protein MUE96_05365 [Bacteroidia bacterium]|jgi:hypothetical protein|nr:hypothetical protein [Bacteroidia bacterium]